MTLDQVLLLVEGAATLAATLSVLCRMGRMTPDTPWQMRWQHGLLLAGLVSTIVLPAQMGHAALALAVMMWLALSASRWREGAPVDPRPQAAEPISDL